MESFKEGSSTSAETHPKYRPNYYVRGARGNLLTESKKAYKDNKKQLENDSQHPKQTPPDPKYNFLADPMRNNDYIETENKDSVTLKDKEFNYGRYQDKNRDNYEVRWNRGGRGNSYNRKNYNNYQQNTSHKNDDANIENTESEENSKRSQYRGNPRYYNSYKKTEKVSQKYSWDKSQNDNESQEQAESDHVKPKFRGNRSSGDQDHAENGPDGENFGRTTFVKGRHSFRDNTSKEEFADRESFGKTRYRGGRHSFRENTPRKQVTEGDNICSTPGFRSNSFRDSESREEHSARPRFEGGRRPHRGNYRGNYNRGAYSNNRNYRKNPRDAKPVNISVEFSVETGDRKCTMEQMKKDTVKQTSEKLVIACEENWDEEEPNTTNKDHPDPEEASCDNLRLNQDGEKKAIKCDVEK